MKNGDLTPYEERWGLADDMERILVGTDRARAAKARLKAQASPTPSEAKPERYIVTENASVGAGKDQEERQRALTLAEKLYRDEIIDVGEWQAAGQLRNLHFLLVPPSEGVSSYGLSPGGGNPARKADRKAKRLTGIEIGVEGDISRGPSRANRSDQWRYRDALFAMAGCNTDEGDPVIDPAVTRIMLRAVTDSENLPTQTEIGQARSLYASKKQLSAIGATFVKEHLRRLAMHFRMVKGEAVR